MKKIKLFLTFSLILSSIFYLLSPAYADTTPTVANQINDLEQRIASRVAQLKLVERRAIIGTVSAVSDTQITLSDLNDNTRFIDVDELTKFNPLTSSKNFGISDIKKGDMLGVLGLYNKQSERLLARFVDVESEDKSIHGVITSLDSKNFEAEATLLDGSTTTLNFTDTSKAFSYTKDKGFAKSGFSKLDSGSHFIALGNQNTKDKSLFDISRIIVLPEISNQASTISPTDTPAPSDTPTPTPRKVSR